MKVLEVNGNLRSRHGGAIKLKMSRVFMCNEKGHVVVGSL